VAVEHCLRRHRTRVVKRHHLGGDEGRVVAIGNRHYAKRADYDLEVRSFGVDLVIRKGGYFGTGELRPIPQSALLFLPSRLFGMILQ